MDGVVVWWTLLLLALHALSLSAEASSAATSIDCPEKCSPQRRGVSDISALSSQACKPSIDYVYKVRVEDSEKTMHTDGYRLTVEEVLKPGTDAEAYGEQRVFISRSACRSDLELEPGKTYLVMGEAESVKELKGSYHYVFGEHTWLEYWPTEEEGKSAAHKARLESLQQLLQDMDFGCPE
ncbi:complement C3-like [Denticeps clupeoides]|uniref:complement C3-like n=1 Tax=Denticeps clupeoides TaxID=299321 RepID=UPI0010A30D32|nr:complement C3-like [Denticeps clupeoides]XP_028828351.1 complement C3-like [Denticeps clupeoides]